MAESRDQPPNRRSPNARVAERLRAHARLCRHIAVATWNEEIAIKLIALADDCTLAAERLEPVFAPVRNRQRF